MDTKRCNAKAVKTKTIASAAINLRQIVFTHQIENRKKIGNKFSEILTKDLVRKKRKIIVDFNDIFLMQYHDIL